VIVRPDGYILTNHHVVENADSIKVELSDNRVFEANVVGSDPPSDLALLQIKAQKLPAIRFGDATKSRVGDVVLAVGNPFGVGETVTMGIVSAVGRAHMGITDYDDFIQTDAAINPGNSGGALVNLRGELVGINTAIVSRSGGFQGVGFAIPSNMARNVSESLRTTGRVARGWLGVSIQSVTPDLAQGLGLSNSVRGAAVSEVQANSPAQRAGLQQGDVIVAVNGQRVGDAGRLRSVVASLGAGAQARLEIRRQARTVTVTTELGELPRAQQSAGNAPAVNGDSKLSGVAVASLGPRERQQYSIGEAVRGVVVTSVDGNSFAARSGLRQGDVIVQVNRQPVTTPAEFQRAATQAAQQVLLLVHRQGRTIYLAWQ
jgi:Do/DeqQ family serine protease